MCGKRNRRRRDKGPSRPARRSIQPVEGARSAEQVLIDKFGHRHTTNVLTIWPEAVQLAMGLRFLDKVEVR
jgi:hypothetical protein